MSRAHSTIVVTQSSGPDTAALERVAPKLLRSSAEALLEAGTSGVLLVVAQSQYDDRSLLGQLEAAL